MMQQLVLDVGLPTEPTLANFFAGPNAAVLQHLQTWLGPADSPGRVVRSPLPTYLWGGGGCGKTHLLRAVQGALQRRGESTGWLDARSASVPEFDPGWSMLLMDDVHALDSVQQQTAFAWFINAQTHQLPVLAAGHLPPADLALRDDLRSRLGWGHVFALQWLDEAARRSVLRVSAQARGLVLSDEVLDYVLARFSRDLGSLIELLDLLDHYALQTRRAITIALIKTMMNQA